MSWPRPQGRWMNGGRIPLGIVFVAPKADLLSLAFIEVRMTGATPLRSRMR